MESYQYNEPVSKLLSCGSLWGSQGLIEPIDYQALGVSQEDNSCIDPDERR